MQLFKILRTLSHLKPTQIYHQLKYRLVHPRYEAMVWRGTAVSGPVEAGCMKYDCCRGRRMTFLNISSDFVGWNDRRHGMLWAYNLNYMDWLNQRDMTFDEGAEWIDRFIDDLPGNAVGLDPYPTALRGINWIKFISSHRSSIDAGRLARWNDSLYSQYHLLKRKLEYHLLGNHLLEDAFSWFIAANYFNENRWLKPSRDLLLKELDEQTLADGAHYEQSPMYHCILLDRLLDCISFDRSGDARLRDYASRMLGHLDSICWSDLSIAHFNDSADMIAPDPGMIFDYARRLGLGWTAIAMSECGYRKLTSGRLEAIVDVGGIAASYQPGHSHADTLSFELRADGRPLVVDTGISTYEKNARRQYERSTEAHNTVTVDGRDSSEVWGGFRVGRRAGVRLLTDTAGDVSASHDGYGRNCRHQRSFAVEGNDFRVIDRLPSGRRGVSRLHLAPGVELLSADNRTIVTDRGTIAVSGACALTVEDDFVAVQYNDLKPSKVICMTFEGELNFTISIA